MIRSVSILLIVLAASAALAHDHYPPACCSGHDCRPAHDGEITVTPQGYRVRPTGELIPFRDRKVWPTHDGRMHRCLRRPTDPASETICIIVDGGGV